MLDHVFGTIEVGYDKVNRRIGSSETWTSELEPRGKQEVAAELRRIADRIDPTGDHPTVQPVRAFRPIVFLPPDVIDVVGYRKLEGEGYCVVECKGLTEPMVIRAQEIPTR